MNMTAADSKSADMAVSPAKTFSLRSLFVLTAFIAVLCSLATFGQIWFFSVVCVVILVVSVIGYARGTTQVSPLLVQLMVFQALPIVLFPALDGGDRILRMFRLFMMLDLYLFVRLYVIYKITGWPEPHLSWLVKLAVLTSPIYVTVVSTYLTEVYGLRFM